MADEMRPRATGYPLKRRTTFRGMDVSIEHDKGDVRSGVDPDGKAWATRMRVPYGYLRRTMGTDGDHLDVFLGPHEDAEHVYVIDVMRPDTGEFDEQKCMLGFDNEHDAVHCFLAHYDDPRFFGGVKEIDLDTFRGRVLHKEHWGDVIKADVGAETDTSEAKTLLAELTGDLLRVSVGERHARRVAEHIRGHHAAAFEQLGGGVRVARGSALEDAALDHARDAKTAREVGGA